MLRYLDRVFRRSSMERRRAATAEMRLAPSGRVAAAIDVLAGLSMLLCRTGFDVGPVTQADLQRRAEAGHTVLGATAAAWEHGDKEAAGVLLERL